jgi:phage host-nuclease inhibitor protein Gam
MDELLTNGLGWLVTLQREVKVLKEQLTTVEDKLKVIHGDVNKQVKTLKTDIKILSKEIAYLKLIQVLIVVFFICVLNWEIYIYREKI